MQYLFSTGSTGHEEGFDLLYKGEKLVRTVRAYMYIFAYVSSNVHVHLFGLWFTSLLKANIRVPALPTDQNNDHER